VSVMTYPEYKKAILMAVPDPNVLLNVKLSC
jgi:hypothetical protein